MSPSATNRLDYGEREKLHFQDFAKKYIYIQIVLGPLIYQQC